MYRTDTPYLLHWCVCSSKRSVTVCRPSVCVSALSFFLTLIEFAVHTQHDSPGAACDVASVHFGPTHLLVVILIASFETEGGLKSHAFFWTAVKNLTPKSMQSELSNCWDGWPWRSDSKILKSNTPPAGTPPFLWANLIHSNVSLWSLPVYRNLAKIHERYIQTRTQSAGNA